VTSLAPSALTVAKSCLNSGRRDAVLLVMTPEDSPLDRFELWQIDEEHSFVPTASSARDIARTASLRKFSQPRMLLQLALFVLSLAVVLASGSRRPESGAEQLTQGLAWGLVIVAIVVGPLAAMGYAVVHRQLRTRFVPGTVVRSGFGPAYFITSSPYSTHCVAYAGVDGLKVFDDYVIVRAEGSWTWHPRALFPNSALARIRQGSVARVS
jgi:hypothetical protein